MAEGYGLSSLPLDLLRCPRTRSRLTIEDGALVSADGGHRYPVTNGVPDFRLFDPPYVSRAEEVRRVALLKRASRDMSFDALVRYYQTEIAASPSTKRIEERIRHRLTLRERAHQRLRYLLHEARFDPTDIGGTLLDLGCGSGEVLAPLAGMNGRRVIGIDISLEELTFARKLLAEEGIEATLVAGCAEALPFADDTFSFIYSPDVIEHVSSQPDYFREAYRTLGPRAAILFNSPNRFCVVAPEPHVGIWGLRFLPRPLVDPASRLLGRGHYIGKRLLSLRELRRLLRAPFADYRITSRTRNPAATSLAGRLFHLSRPVSVKMFAHVCDQHVVLARRSS